MLSYYFYTHLSSSQIGSTWEDWHVHVTSFMKETVQSQSQFRMNAKSYNSRAKFLFKAGDLLGNGKSTSFSILKLNWKISASRSVYYL